MLKALLITLFVGLAAMAYAQPTACTNSDAANMRIKGKVATLETFLYLHITNHHKAWHAVDTNDYVGHTTQHFNEAGYLQQSVDYAEKTTFTYKNGERESTLLTIKDSLVSKTFFNCDSAGTLSARTYSYAGRDSTLKRLQNTKLLNPSQSVTRTIDLHNKKLQRMVIADITYNLYTTTHREQDSNNQIAEYTEHIEARDDNDNPTRILIKQDGEPNQLEIRSYTYYP